MSFERAHVTLPFPPLLKNCSALMNRQQLLAAVSSEVNCDVNYRLRKMNLSIYNIFLQLASNLQFFPLLSNL